MPVPASGNDVGSALSRDDAGGAGPRRRGDTRPVPAACGGQAPRGTTRSRTLGARRAVRCGVASCHPSDGIVGERRVKGVILRAGLQLTSQSNAEISQLLHRVPRTRQERQP
jgi:hypothetical protein